MSTADASKIWHPTASLTSPDSTCWSGTVTAPKSEWQPIETVPKDGVAVLAFRRVDDENDMFVVTWWDRGGDCWRFGAHDRLRQNVRPTHWMPLPAAPSDIGR